MCGIAGAINFNGEPISSDLLKKMTSAISHRGPDGEGHWSDGNIGLGHRRLSIIDLSSAGNQPMFCNNNRYVISYNGEVYNFKELKRELEILGYGFASKTDTEVILYSLIEWGEDAVNKFNGMFAFAFWDRKERKMLLARDRYGIKPLYYSHQGSRFAFASEQKAIITHPEFEKSLNKSALLEYFTFQNIFTDQTLLNDIKMFPAGNYMTINLADECKQKIKLVQYWDYQFSEPKVALKKEDYIEELDRLFQQAVNRQLLGDVELGSYLSGGMDSGSITAISARSLTNLKTFTCGFDLSSASGMELTFDERVKAEAMSALFKTEHYEMVLKSGDMERCLDNYAWHLEEPRVGQSYPNYYAAQLASKFVKVVLSGTGGDELFGGYPWRYYRSASSKNFENYIDDYYNYWQRLASNSELKKIFAPIWDDLKDIWTRDIFRDVFNSHNNELTNPEDYINHSLYFESKTFLHGLLMVEDKLSMAHSLESRVPFLDNDLVDFAMKCPISLKLNNLSNAIRINENQPGRKTKNYFLKTNDGKQILRDVMSGYIPKDITEAAKQGFSSPDASWFKGESIDFVKRRLLDENAIIYELMDRKFLSSLINQHTNGLQNRRLLIWSLLNLEAWMRVYKI